MIEYKCLCCNKHYQHKFDEKLIHKNKWFFNTHKFSNHNNSKFIWLLRKGVHPYEYMDDWENFNKILPEKENFYSNLNMEDTTDWERMLKEFVKILKSKI